jgi:uncharacterized damage-inducible protein DinB
MSQLLKPDQASLLLNTVFLPGLSREHPCTKRVIEAIPDTKTDYRPDPNSKTALELAWHIAASEKRFLEAIANGGFNFDPIPRPESVKTGADIAHWYDEMFQAVLARLKTMPKGELSKVLDFRGMMQQPAVLFFPIAINHMVHHRGQLSTYLRPMGGKGAVNLRREL